jgi:hypothetical protein
MTADITLLGEAERTRRLAADASSNPANRTVTMCSEADCPRAASGGPWCRQHRPPAAPPPEGWSASGDLTAAQLAEVAREVEEKAAPLFLLAMEFIARQQIARMGLELEAGPR